MAIVHYLKRKVQLIVQYHLCEEQMMRILDLGEGLDRY